MPKSPKVATYDLRPEMSSAEVTAKFVEAIELAGTTYPELAQELRALSTSLPHETADSEDCTAWAEEMRRLTMLHLYSGLDASQGIVHLNLEEVTALNRYLYLTKLLVDALTSDIYCSKEVRNAIIESLLLPPDSEDISPLLRTE